MGSHVFFVVGLDLRVGIQEILAANPTQVLTSLFDLKSLKLLKPLSNQKEQELPWKLGATFKLEVPGASTVMGSQ